MSTPSVRRVWRSTQLRHDRLGIERDTPMDDFLNVTLARAVEVAVLLDYLALHQRFWRKGKCEQTNGDSNSLKCHNPPELAAEHIDTKSVANGGPEFVGSGINPHRPDLSCSSARGADQIVGRVDAGPGKA